MKAVTSQLDGQSAGAVSYRVLYADAGVKKRKSFSDGFLHIKPAAGNSFSVSLVSEDGDQLRKSTEKNIKAFKEGTEVTCGAYLVQLEDLVTAPAGTSNPPPPPIAAPTASKYTSSMTKTFVSSTQTSQSILKPANKFVNPIRTLQKPLVSKTEGLYCTIPQPENEPPATDLPTVADAGDDFWDQEITAPAASVKSNSFNSSTQNLKFNKNLPRGSVTATAFRTNSTTTNTATHTTITPSSSNTNPSTHNRPYTSTTASASTSPTKVEQDPSLMRVMRPHQIVGADFLIVRLLNNPTNTTTNNNTDNNASGAGNGGAGGSGVNSDNSEFDLGVDRDNVCTGAILADEMGVGKTLTAISTVYAFVRTKTPRKCLIICPSSLVENWVKEIKHWLGTNVKPLVIKSGGDASSVINTFVISMHTLYPLLVVSYEMFRKHAALLNTVPNLELMVCDEGHRLKNIGGTKTMQALSACKAFRRVILSGTPVQNDLDELYAVVSFVAPGYLGSLSTFKSRIASVISRGNESTSSPSDKVEAGRASAALRDLLGRIMLRRTQADILQGHLPPRADFVVYCKLNRAQRAEYEHTAAEVKRCLGSGGVVDCEYDELGEAVEENKSASGGGMGGVLPLLQSLRQVCNSTTAVTGSSSLLSHRVSNHGGGGDVGGVRGRSSKLQVLASLLHHLRATSPEEKVVVVSNFTSTLDTVHTLLQGVGWGNLLRLDGKVPVDQRQGLVNRFNNASDPSQVFLLSAKAGGVGINLIGGSRLIMFDVDWNPATDQQAMSRVWREGQPRPVFVYRLVASGTIEEAMLQRQRSKTDLAGYVEGGDNSGAGTRGGGGDGLEGIGGFGQKNMSEKRMSLTRKDVLHLLYPNKVERGGVSGGTDSDLGTGSDGVDSGGSGGSGDEDSIGDLDVDDLLGNTTDIATTDSIVAPVKEIRDIILLSAMRQLGTEVIVRAICTD